MARTLTLPLWKVGVTAVALDKTREYFVDGKSTPCTKVSSGYITVHGETLERARQVSARVIRELYDEEIVNIAYFNTHKVDNHARELSGFNGLIRRVL